MVYCFPKIVGFGGGFSFELKFAKWFQGISKLSKKRKKKKELNDTHSSFCSGSCGDFAVK